MTNQTTSAPRSASESTTGSRVRRRPLSRESLSLAYHTSGLWSLRALKFLGLILASALILTSTVVAFSGLGLEGSWARKALQVGFALLAAGGGLLLWIVAARILLGTPESLWLSTPRADKLDTESGELIGYVSQAQFNVAMRYSNPAIKVFHSILTDTTLTDTPRLVRATEHAEPDGESLALATLLDYVLTDSERQDLKKADEQSVLIPFMSLEKGVLLDNFDATDPSGRTVPTLSQHETMGLLALTVASLFYLAYKSDNTRLRKVRQLTNNELRAQWKLIQLVCQRGKRKPEEVSNEFDAAVKELDATSRNRAIELRTFCRFFATHYLIVAEVPLPAGNHVILKYRKSIPLDDRTSELTDNLRVRAGLMPRKFKVSLTLPFQAPSYHFRISSGESGRFVSSHYLWDIKEKKVLDQAEIAPMAMSAVTADDSGDDEVALGVEQRAPVHPYLRVRSKEGLPYAHLYTRGLHGSKPLEIATVVTLDEVPPGALGSARSISLATSVLVSAFAFIIPAAKLESSNLAALILAAPAFVASWVGHSAERMQRSSLTAHVCLVITGLISIASAVLYVARTMVHRPRLDWQFKERGATFPEVDLYWFGLAALSIATTLLLWSQLRQEKRRYMEMLKEPKDIDVERQ